MSRSDVKIELGVRVAFTDGGAVVLGDDGRLRFPPLPGTAAIYRLVLSGPGEPRVYLGETENARRRGGHYRNPGATQRTSTRINALLVEHLTAGGTVTVFLANAAEVLRNGSIATLDLTTKAARVLAEHAALVAAKLDGERVLNL